MNYQIQDASTGEPLTDWKAMKAKDVNRWRDQVAHKADLRRVDVRIAIQKKAPPKPKTKTPAKTKTVTKEK